MRLFFPLTCAVVLTLFLINPLARSQSGLLPDLDSPQIVIDPSSKAWIEHEVDPGFLYSVEYSDSLADESFIAIPNAWYYASGTTPTLRRVFMKQLPIPQTGGGGTGGTTTPLPSRNATVLTKALRGPFGESTGLYIECTINGATWRKQTSDSWPSQSAIVNVTFEDATYAWTLLVINSSLEWSTSQAPLPQTTPWTAGNQSELASILGAKDSIIGQISRIGEGLPSTTAPNSGDYRYLRVARSAIDTDKSGMPDWWEKTFGMDPFVRDEGDSAQEDLDGDGLVNGEELAAGSNPLIADTDADGVNDGDEVAGRTSPTNSGEHPLVWVVDSRSCDYVHDVVISTNRFIFWGSLGNGVTQFPQSRSGQPELSFTQLSGDLANKYPFPESHAQHLQRSLRLNAYAGGATLKSTVYEGAGLSHARVWMRIKPAPKEPGGISKRILHTQITRQNGVLQNASLALKNVTMSQNLVLSTNHHANTDLLPYYQGPDVNDLAVQYRASTIDLADESAYSGLDSLSFVPSIMVPKGGQNRFYIKNYLGYTVRKHPTTATSSISPLTLSSNTQLVTVAAPTNAGANEGIALGIEGAYTTEPVVQVDVRDRLTVKVTVHPITLLNSTGGIRATPQWIPSQSEMQAYLNSTFGEQANVFFEVGVSQGAAINWDVGVNPQAGTAGAQDGVFAYLTPGQKLAVLIRLH